MCDWIDDFLEKFKNDAEVKNLKKDEFFGHLQINFYKGKVVDLNKYQTRKPVCK